MSDDGLRHRAGRARSRTIYNLAYNVVSNAMLWFCHHHLFDAARRPRADRRWLRGLGGLPRVQPAVRRAGGQGGAGGGPGPRPGLPPGPDGLRPGPAPARPADRALHPHPVRRSVGAADAPHRGGRPSCSTPWPDSGPADSTPSGGRPPTGPARRWPAAAPAAGTDPSGPTFVSPLSTDPDRLRRLGRRAGGGRGPGPHRGADRGGRPAGHRPGGPDGAVEEPAPGILGLRRAAGAAAAPARSGWSSWPWPTPPVRACPSTSPTRTRWSRPWTGSTSGGAPRAGPRSCSRWRTTTPGRWPPCPATTSCWSTRCATASTWWPRRAR